MKSSESLLWIQSDVTLFQALLRRKKRTFLSHGEKVVVRLQKDSATINMGNGVCVTIDNASNGLWMPLLRDIVNYRYCLNFYEPIREVTVNGKGVSEGTAVRALERRQIAPTRNDEALRRAVMQHLLEKRIMNLPAGERLTRKMRFGPKMTLTRSLDGRYRIQVPNGIAVSGMVNKHFPWHLATATYAANYNEARFEIEVFLIDAKFLVRGGTELQEIRANGWNMAFLADCVLRAENPLIARLIRESRWNE